MVDYNEINKKSQKRQCQPRNRCHLFKTGEPCARIRQARLCDITELASRFSSHATYAVVMPIGKAQNQNTIKKLKTNLTRKMRKSTDGLMTSIETSANDALHLNLIINSKEIITPRPFQTVIKNLGIEADIFVEKINKNDVRKVTAYSLKKQSIPTLEQYEGNTLNLSGNMKSFKQIMQSKRMIKHSPIIAITSMCNTLIKFGLEPPTKALLETPRLQRSLDNLIYLTSQLKELDMCYSEKHGLLTAKEFFRIYKRKIGQCKRDVGRKKRHLQFDNRWRKLPKGISLKEHLES